MTTARFVMTCKDHSASPQSESTFLRCQKEKNWWQTITRKMFKSPDLAKVSCDRAILIVKRRRRIVGRLGKAYRTLSAAARLIQNRTLIRKMSPATCTFLLFERLSCFCGKGNVGTRKNKGENQNKANLWKTQDWRLKGRLRRSHAR